MIKKPAEIIQDRMNPNQSRGGLGGLLDYAREQNPNTGLSRFQNFAAALDPLIMPEMRAGEAIRERGMQRVAAGNVNKTVEWLKNNGYADAAAVIEANPSAASNVVSAILSNRMKPKDTFRIATPEEAKAYGALAGQFDSSGKFYPTQKVELSNALTGTNKTKAQAMLMSYDSIQNSISVYKDMVDTGGIGVMPGTQRDLLQSARTSLQLQMKDLFELGVLAGPDMDLLNALVFDTTDPKNYLTQALGGGTAEERFKASIQNLENQMKILIAPKIKALETKPTITNGQTDGNNSGFSVTSVVPGR
tara:strand:- start:2427 stop:3341 length:915 start_codon:yes stop_codon:yes gene_type:complete